MKTDELPITQSGGALGDILDKIELIALYTGMKRREATSMRLLAEELLIATRDVMAAYQGRLWVETSDKAFTLHLLAGIEKSIIDAIVDDIVVSMPRGQVEIVAVKNL